MSQHLLMILLALAGVFVALARLIPQPTAVRVLDVAAVVLAGLVFLAEVLPVGT